MSREERNTFEQLLSPKNCVKCFTGIIQFSKTIKNTTTTTTTNPKLSTTWLFVISVAKACVTLCDPMDSSPPGSSVHEISQTRILEWVAISFPRGSCQPRDWTCVSCTGKQNLYHWAYYMVDAFIIFFLQLSKLKIKDNKKFVKSHVNVWHSIKLQICLISEPLCYTSLKIVGNTTITKPFLQMSRMSKK